MQYYLFDFKINDMAEKKWQTNCPFNNFLKLKYFSCQTIISILSRTSSDNKFHFQILKVIA